MQCLSLAYRSMGLCLPVLGSLLGAPTLWKYVRNARLTESNTDGTSSASYWKTEEVYKRTTTPVTIQSESQTKVVMGAQTVFIPGRSSHVTGLVRADHSI